MRKEQELDDIYKKDAYFERVLSLMNETLFESEGVLTEQLPETYPTIHVIGAPRSGTTLAVQILAEKLDIGYINNLIAAFWKAPLFGIALSKQLLQSEYVSNYQSAFGRTNKIQEPHEFGYFWNYHLAYNDFQQKDEQHEQNIDWSALSFLLKNMCRAFDKPLLFKSFLYGFHASKAVEMLQKTCFIYIRRNVIDNAMSILKMRRKYLGEVEKWASIKPKQYHQLKNRDIYTQAVGQVLFLEYEYFKQLRQIPDENRLCVDYKQLCKQPGEVCLQVNEMLAHHYQKLDVTEENRNQHFKRAAYGRDNTEIKRLEEAQVSLLNDYPELNSLIENRNQEITF